SELQRVFHSRSAEIRAGPWIVERRAPDLPLSPLSPRRLRSTLNHGATMRFLFACVLGLIALRAYADDAPRFRLATFSAEVTPPLGHPCMGGGIAPVQRIDDPLYANGFVLFSDAKPVVVVAVDWCEIRNDAYERWREVLAQAAGTSRERVLVTCLHQHDAP